MFVLFMMKIQLFFCRYLKLQTLEDGETGHLEFNGDGDRMNPMYNVMNVKKNGLSTVGRYSAALVCIIHHIVGLYSLYTSTIICR